MFVKPAAVKETEWADEELMIEPKSLFTMVVLKQSGPLILGFRFEFLFLNCLLDLNNLVSWPELDEIDRQVPVRSSNFYQGPR